MSTKTAFPIAAFLTLGSASASLPAAAQDRPLAGDFAEVCRVGGPAAPEWAYFTAPSSAGFDAAGNLHILDDEAGQIVVVDSQCNLVRTVGRKGQGPGEFNQASMLAVWRDGRVAVMDLGHTAYQTFGPDGEFERFVRMGDGQGPMAMFSGMRTAIRPDPGADALIAQGATAMMGRMSAAVAQIMGGGDQPEGVDDRGLERLDLAGEVVSATPVLQGWRAPREDAGEPVRVDPADPVGMMETMLGDQVAFEPGFHWDLLPDGTIVWSDSMGYAIKFASPGGSVQDVVERPISPHPVTERIRRRMVEASLAQLDETPSDPRLAQAREMMAMMPGLMAAARKAIEEMEFHSEVPVVQGLKSTWEGGVWVRRIGDEPWDDSEPDEPWEVNEPIDVFDPERAYVGTFDGSVVDMPDAFGPDGLIADWEIDELDVPTIVISRLPEGVR